MWLADEDTNSILTDNTNRAGKKVDKSSPSPLPRDLSEHIPLIVTTNIRVTTLLCRCNNKYLDIIWKLHCYNLFALLQQLCVEIILLQLLNVVTVLIHRITCICYNIFLKCCNNGVFYYKLWRRPKKNPWCDIFLKRKSYKDRLDFAPSSDFAISSLNCQNARKLFQLH